jgi:hypothetical protein
MKFIMTVSYTYRTDEQDSMEQTTSKAQPKTSAPDMKTFTFSTVIYLGTVVQREGAIPRKNPAADDENM